MYPKICKIVLINILHELLGQTTYVILCSFNCTTETIQVEDRMQHKLHNPGLILRGVVEK